MEPSLTTHSASTTGRGDSRPSSGSMPAAELALASRLFDALACGHGRLAFNITGTFPLWQRRKRPPEQNAPAGEGAEPRAGKPWRLWEPVPGCERVPAGEWRPCLEVKEDGTTKPRHFNPYLLAGHVRGDYDIAPMAPSWCGGFRLDLDAQI